MAWKSTLLVLDAKDNVYAATDPDGKIYKIGSDGKPQLFYDPHQKYIWAMAFNSKGDLFVATGDQGEIYRVTPDGRGLRLLQDRRDACALARHRRPRQPDRRHRAERPDPAHLASRPGLRAVSIAEARDHRGGGDAGRRHLRRRRRQQDRRVRRPRRLPLPASNPVLPGGHRCARTPRN